MVSTEMTHPMPTPKSISIIMTTAVPEEMNNTTIVPTSPSDVGIISKMCSTMPMNMTTDLTVTQEMASTYKAFAIEKQYCCTHAPKSIFMVDWKRTKSSKVWDNIVLINCETLKVVIEKAMSEVNNTE